jgi:short subunit dehydrogenase-like uncharacterized protein
MPPDKLRRSRIAHLHLRRSPLPQHCQADRLYDAVLRCSTQFQRRERGQCPCVPVSWGDVATAFHSTGIENIIVYFRRTRLLRSANILGKLFGPLFRSRIGQRGLAAIVRSFPEGPSQAERIGHRGTIWAEAIDRSRRSSKASLSTPDPYDFTANSALEISSRINSLQAAPGLVTPSQAFGPDFVLSLPGCSRMDIPSSETDSPRPSQ